MKPGILINAFLLVVVLLGFVPAPVHAQPAFMQVDDYDCSVQTEIPTAECAALVALYNSTNGPGWRYATGWLMTDSPCSWYGIVCNSGHITAVDLTYNQLSGNIPPELGSLTYLQSLNLSENQIGGSIPPDLGSLANLQSLNLYRNQLIGSIPPELGGLTNLIDLLFHDNQLSSSIPSQLSSLTNLQTLELSNNRLTGNIPPTLGSLANLQFLNLSSNQLSGGIPVELGSLANLQRLGLFRNQLSGSLPPDLAGLTKLQILHLSENQLSGNIPPELSNLANLQGLYLYDNQLSGSIPPELGGLSNLQYLVLNFNQLSGSIPPELGDLTNLIDLYLDTNQLTGSIPPELGSLTNLRRLYLQTNQFSGSIPPELGSLTSLEWLYLHSNQLSGSMPAELGSLANLHSLYLSGNQLSGSIPPELGSLANVHYLYLSNNQLSGSIPPELGNLTFLRFLSFDNNPLSGALPASFVNLPLYAFNFSKTQLCEPADSAFQTWLGSIENLYRTNITCWIGNPPIILLPGMMGSRLYNTPANANCAGDAWRPFGEVWLPLKGIPGLESLVLKPAVTQPVDGCNGIEAKAILDNTAVKDLYSPFIEDLTEAGHTVIRFPYDWRLSLEDSAAKLDQLINAQGITNAVLVGHGMGGLLARAYVESHPEKVDKVISVGAPYWGAPRIALNMRSGLPPVEIPNGEERPAALPVVADIIRNSPGAMQLLPSEAYFANRPGGYMINHEEALSSYQGTRDFLADFPGKHGKQNGPLIDAARSFHQQYDDFRNIAVDYYILAPMHLGTISKIREYACPSGLLPDTCYEMRELQEGDGSVPYTSMSLAGMAGPTTHIIPLPVGQVDAAHDQLMIDPKVIAAIKNILTDQPAVPAGHASPMAQQLAGSFIHLSVLGAADVSVRDSADHFSGIDAGGAVVNEIPGATYDALGSQTEIVLPPGQAYTVTMKEWSDFPLEIRVSEMQASTAGDAFTPQQRAVFLGVPSRVDGVITLPLDLTAGLAALRLAVDLDHNGAPEASLPANSIVDAQQVQDISMPTTTISLDGNQGWGGLYSGTVTVTLAAADTGTGILRTEYSLDGGQTWQVYPSPVSFSAVPVFYARSVDVAGNYEYPWVGGRMAPWRILLPGVMK